LVEQTVTHLREGILTGRWIDQLPGVDPLSLQLMVSKGIVRVALGQLETVGLLQECGSGRRRKIVKERVREAERRPLRFGIMLYEPFEDDEGQMVKILLGIRHAIEVAGHVCIFSDRSLTQLNGNLSRISRLVKAVDADAWIVLAASREVLEWFIAQPFPVYAYGGRFHDLPVACSTTLIGPAIEAAVSSLLDLGHRRIVMLAPTSLRQPTPIPSLARYLALLEERGIPAATDYNLPHFEDTAEGLQKCLSALFQVTPPTALLMFSASHYAAAYPFFARYGLQVPRDVSVLCMVMEPAFRMCQPTVAHFQMPVKEHVACMARWVNGVAKMRPSKRQVFIDAVYVPGGTVGPAKK
jgi:DNA-binding LacI/PurR family transcriptional regulator